MPRDIENARRWRREHKRKLRAAWRAMPLHAKLGIETTIVRVAILDDPRMGRHFDPLSRVYSHNHLYRESITLARV
jgi:hypothetical protein